MKNWWTVALGFSILLTTSCGSSEPGKPLPMDEEDASHEMEKIAFAISDDFHFVQGVKYAEFVGQPAWSARFDSPNDLDGRAVIAADPSYPPLQSATCGAVTTPSWTALGFRCEDQMLVTSRPARGSKDAVSVVFTSGARGSSLFIHSQGH